MSKSLKHVQKTLKRALLSYISFEYFNMSFRRACHLTRIRAIDFPARCRCIIPSILTLSKIQPRLYCCVHDACVKRLTAFAGSVDENRVMVYTHSQTARPAEEKTAESNGERSEKYSVTYGGRRGEASAAKLCPKKKKTREHEEDEVEEEVKAR